MDRSMAGWHDPTWIGIAPAVHQFPTHGSMDVQEVLFDHLPCTLVGVISLDRPHEINGNSST